MTLTTGNLVVLPFPYTDLSSTKQRPALTLTPAPYNQANPDAILAYVTSAPQPASDPYTLPVTQDNLADGSLIKPSWIRTDKLFTLDQALIRKTVATLNPDTIHQIQSKLAALLLPETAA